MIRCEIPCLFTLAVKIYPVPFLAKENDNRGIGIWRCRMGNINLVGMKVAYICHDNKFNHKFNAALSLSLLLWDSGNFDDPRSSHKYCTNWICCSLPVFWFSCSDSIELFRFLFSKYNFLLSLISCCIFSFCSSYFSDSRLWLASRSLTVFFINLISS